MQQRLSRRSLLAGLAAQRVKRPNFVLILADDMGFSDAGCYGGEVATPQLDRLAAGGLRFTQCYSTARCGPSRSCLLTGQYAQQTAADIMTPGNVPESVRFLPEYLRPLGYRSYHCGKWHMRFVTGEGGVGFDRSFATLDAFRYFTQSQHELDGKLLPKPGPDFYSTTAIADYALRFLGEHEQQHAERPFFLYLPFHAPHFPLQALAGDIAAYDGRFAEGWDAARERKLARMRKMGLVDCGLAPLEAGVWPRWNTKDAELLEKVGPGEVTRALPWAALPAEQKQFQRMKMAIHAAMITRMDTEIGRVRAQIEGMGAMRDTVFLFLSDNGASAEMLIRGDGHDKTARPGSAETHLGLGPGWSSNANAPFRLHKAWLQEGGISSPCIVHWPAGIRDAGKLRHDVCHFVDVLPTLVDLAGGEVPQQTAGRSMKPAFARDGGAAKKDYLYFNHNNNRALRVGDWKAISTGKDGPWELYNLKRDRAEQTNVGAREPERLQQMKTRWETIDAEFTRTREAASPTKKLRMKNV
jgi:arylsulfatase A-like enzyme